MAGNVQQALATALTKPSRNASGRAAHPTLGACNISVVHFNTGKPRYLQHPEGPHPPAPQPDLDAATYA